jgi:hypothetical protein
MEEFPQDNRVKVIYECKRKAYNGAFFLLESN